MPSSKWQAEGLPAIERTIELNPDVAGRLKGRVLLWGDEAAAVRLLERNRCPVSVILCSDLLYGDGAPASAAEGGAGGDGAEEGESGATVGAAEALAITLSALDRSSECVILSCHERR